MPGQPHPAGPGFPAPAQNNSTSQIMMKKSFFSALFVALLLGDCQAPAEEWPQDLAGKRSLLETKRKELAELNRTIRRLEMEIDSLDPGSSLRNAALVTTDTVERSDFRKFVEIQGTVQSDKIVNVTSEVPGRLIRLHVEEGDAVRKGELIAELDLEQVKKQLEEAQTSLDLATTVYERQKSLWDQNIGSEIQFLEAKNNKERLEKNIESLQLQLSKSKVYAPIGGVVDRKLTKEGEYASPGAPIVQLLDVNNLKVEADVPETYLRSVRKGERVQVRFPALGLEQEARVSLVGSIIKNANRTFKVEARVRSANGMLKPNLLAIMLIRESEQKDVVVVPLVVVQQEVSGKEYVFVLEEGKPGPVARKVYVETGDSYGGNIVITDGLSGGETLIVEGARGLANKQPIRVKTQANNG
jgi:RND family efflux transporter MFP subunit